MSDEDKELSEIFNLVIQTSENIRLAGYDEEKLNMVLFTIGMNLLLKNCEDGERATAARTLKALIQQSFDELEKK
jgi:hypothetical protein